MQKACGIGPFVDPVRDIESQGLIKNIENMIIEPVDRLYLLAFPTKENKETYLRTRYAFEGTVMAFIQCSIADQ